MKLCLFDEPPIPPEVKNIDTLAYYICKTLGLIPQKGKGDISLEMLKLFVRIAPIKEGSVEVNNEQLPVKNGSMKAKDILIYLRSKGISISQAQFYNTYLHRFLESGIIRKRGVFYGLRAPTLELTLMELERDMMRIMEKVREHARRVGRYVENQ